VSYAGFGPGSKCRASKSTVARSDRHRVTPQPPICTDRRSSGLIPPVASPSRPVRLIPLRHRPDGLAHFGSCSLRCKVVTLLLPRLRRPFRIPLRFAPASVSLAAYRMPDPLEAGASGAAMIGEGHDHENLPPPDIDSRAMRLETDCDFTPMTRAERSRAKKIHRAVEAAAKLPKESGAPRSEP
jgi:hypothetical protein